ncbi:BRCT domain-containing protein [Crepidotus variabilis]|uniref:BRCT domain-containing protein n=1 Tax=Crepidotus variabilis TaxID=179855 RepID=A0A9P6JUE9_9AGAR|nr:BRCT domain-containing protein [Crepidotus variabilis]
MEAYFPLVAKSKSNTGKDTQETATQKRSSVTLTKSLATIDITMPQSLRSSLPSSVEVEDVAIQLLKTLSNPKNPITHSDIADRTQHYVAFSRGHQEAEERIDHTKYMAHREAKLKVQRDNIKSSESSNNQVLSGVKAYINGYLESTTDIEMKRVVTEGGGQIIGYPSSQCTHIITSRCLSGSKTHKMLTMKPSKVKVVKPDWVFDSLAKGKRQPERSYSLLRSRSTSDLY